MGKGFGWIVVGLAAGLMLTGCAEMDRMNTLKEDFKAQETGQQAASTVDQSGTKGEKGKDTGNSKVSTGEGQMISLYFTDENGKYLAEEKRVIPKDVEALRRSVQELAKGPVSNSKLVPTLPEGTKVRGIVLDKEGTCTVDFSQELVKKHGGGSTGETLTVFSIVDTLTQFEQVKKVKITVEGEPIETIAGHIDVSEAMARNTKVLQPE